MSPLDDILQRLENIEHRLARLEAAAALVDIEPRSNPVELRRAPAPAIPAPQPAPISATMSVSTAGVPPKTAAPPLPAVEPITERLTPVPRKPPDGEAPFPDLSMIDEKLEPRKGPAEKLDVRAALEDYPRICTRIQQLWGAPECEGYINDLVIDTRGNRKGFPPAMMEELLYLGRLARALVILSVGGDIWETLDQVGDRR